MQLTFAEMPWLAAKIPPPDGDYFEKDRALSASDRSDALKVLVVDDETIIADTLVEILIGEGYTAVAASSGESAIALAETFQPDIVISDVVMSDPNGIEVAIQVRRLLPDCRILLLSGQTATVDLLRDARARGYEFDIVAKPIKPQLLLSLLRRRP
jgi:CheY-like chemotaxis protein